MLMLRSKSFQYYKDIANAKAKLELPSYDVVLSNADKAVSSSSFMGYINLDGYNPEACANYCNSKIDCKSCK